jgi:hypothetical protein
MARPRKPGTPSRFSVRLDAYVGSLIASGDRKSHADVAKEFRVGASTLSKALTKEGPVAAQFVARVCSRVDRQLAAELFKLHLLDHADLVTEISMDKGYRSLKSEDNLRIFVTIRNTAVD